MLPQRRFVTRGDLTLLVIVGLILTIGLLMIYSSTRGALLSEDQSPFKKVRLQMVWLAIALVAMAVAAAIDYEKIVALAIPIMGGVVFLLVVVVLMAHFAPESSTVRGTVRWIGFGPVKLQPSELAKVAVILVLAGYLALRQDEVDTLSLVSRSLIYAGVPAGLIFIQPDLGTPTVIMFIWLVVLYVAGARLAHLGAFVLAAVLLFGAAWNLGVIRPHQKARLTAFLAPEDDPTGAGWQLRQSMIAIGSGRMFGQGLFKGKQTQLNFVPDQETDFIFTAIGEELGFVGCVVVLGLYGLLLWRTFRIAGEAKDDVGRLIAAGIGGLFAIHVVVNVGMTIGLMPVKGMPLPFLSYGGSNLVTNMLCVGLLENVYMRRHKIVF
jgi:rod shape determining protein RodA